MTATGLERAQAKMRDAGVAEAAIDVFTHYYGQLSQGHSGFILEEDIEPMTEVPQLADMQVDAASPPKRWARPC